MFSFLDPKEDAIEKSKFLTAFCKGVTEQNNMLHLDQLGAELSEKVLQYWMANINRSLSNYQVRDHPYITPAKGLGGVGLEKLQFLLMFSTIYASCFTKGE